ncbi:hypothetical protein AHMF7616_01880 [Adhaeribacter pallidiroseus]|uniref:Uncharacterized protein n=1 Tax=Adhaeribacter pallidiroseus TaxID=2072847 RepID=A0A369QM04_9BACT|nr:hypothetical protein AHMF7616_01880 [Adhaeribacter pallidiroseus]
MESALVSCKGLFGGGGRAFHISLIFLIGNFQTAKGRAVNSALYLIFQALFRNK